MLARTEAGMLRRDATRFFLSTGSNHSHLFTSTQTIGFRSELEHFGLDTGAQLQRWLSWALAPRSER